MNLRDVGQTFRGHRVPRLDLIGRKRIWFAVSGFLVVLSLAGLVFGSLNFSIEFTGGALLQFPNRSGAAVSDYQGVMGRFGLGNSSVEILGGDTVSIRTEDLGLTPTPVASPTPTPTVSASPTGTSSPGPSATPTPTPTASSSPAETPSPTASPSAGTTPTPSAIPTTVPSPTGGGTETLRPAPGVRVGDLTAALARTAGIPPEEVSTQAVGPTWGSTITRKAIISLLIFLVLVTLFITIVFSEWKMAAAALVALAHDIVITAGIYVLVGREVTPGTVIAILTILGYSLYDTVVIFDKVKENTESAALVARETYSGVVNMSVNQTFMRSVNTSLVVLLPIGALLLFGGQTLKDFAFALFVGVASGAYSSIFIAAPVLALLKEREPRFQQIRARVETRTSRPGLRPVLDSGDGPPVAAVPRRAETAGAMVGSGSPGPRPASPASSSVSRPGGPKKGGSRSRPQGKPKRRRR